MDEERGAEPGKARTTVFAHDADVNKGILEVSLHRDLGGVHRDARPVGQASETTEKVSAVSGEKRLECGWTLGSGVKLDRRTDGERLSSQRTCDLTLRGTNSHRPTGPDHPKLQRQRATTCTALYGG